MQSQNKFTVKPRKDIVGSQLFYAYSTWKIFVWAYLLLGLLRQEGCHSPLGMQSCCMAPLSTPLGEWERSPGLACPHIVSQAQFIPARWQVPLKSAVFHTSWRKRQEPININMVWFCLGIAVQYIISLTCAVLVTFISVAVCRTVL